MKPVVNLYKLGRLPYVKAFNVQQLLFDKLKHRVTSPDYDLARINANVNLDPHCFNNPVGGNLNDYQIGNSLVLVEHEPVYTIGIRSKQYNDKYVSQLKEKLDELKLKADFVETNRGGLITFHGPGQLVAYPIIYLGDFKTKIRDRSVKAYVNLLEDTIIDTLAGVGIQDAHTVKEYPGVWLDGGERKIAFIGIACKRYVTMHGISINCDCDLSWFDHIVSCGIEDKSITSVKQELLITKEQTKELHKKLDKQETTSAIIKEDNWLSNSCAFRSNVESISKAFCISFSRHFDCNIIEELNLGKTQSSIEEIINSPSI